MTTKKKAKVIAISDEAKCKAHYKIASRKQDMNENELIDWLAQIAHDAKFDWGWIRRELNHRFAELRKALLKQQKNYDGLWNSHYRDLDKLGVELTEIKGQLVEARKDLAAEDRDFQAIADEAGVSAITREAIVQKIRELKSEINEQEQTAELCHKADMRAIEMWQEAHPGNDHVWPDAAKLTLWLMERVAEQEALLKQAGTVLG